MPQALRDIKTIKISVLQRQMKIRDDTCSCSMIRHQIIEHEAHEEIT
ncbi:MAG: hypothetical protein ACI8VT_003380, partial [Saprospiraceae bacterium]